MNDPIRRFLIFNSMKNTESTKITSLIHIFFIIDVITNSMKIYEFTLNNSRYVQFYFKGNANRVIVEFIFYIDESTLLVTKNNFTL